MKSEPATLVLFWDYDTQWGADRSRAPGGPKSWGPLEFENTEPLLDLLAQYEFPSCFAVVGSAALPGERPYHDPAQIRRIREAGHEIASHAHRHEWLPGLDSKALRETLRSSKDALEQCVGAEVVTFVPPFNQPFDHASGFSYSLSERRESRTDRTDLTGLCTALVETGYRFCRVAYRPMHVRLAERITRRRLDYPSRMERIAGLDCVRLNTPGGFGLSAIHRLEKYMADGGIWSFYAHPHSLRDRATSQTQDRLERFLKLAAQWRRDGRVQCRLPREILNGSHK
ncbi:MAG: polysaccharide deacetylase family protein [Acidobacteriota bacterium]